MSDDPFDCFGSDSEGEEEVAIEQSENLSNTKTDKREKSCGVLSFHPNTEQSLLMHVQNAMNDFDKDTQEILPCERVLSEIDWFCSQRHWMMHVGPEKGAIIQKTLKETIETFQESDRAEFLAVECGTYCGYGSIFLASLLKKWALENENEPLCNFHLFTVEINPEYANVARKLIALAQVDDLVTVVENELLMDGSTANIAELIKSSFQEKYQREFVDECDRLDFVMIDHDKDSYLSDLKRLETSRLISAGTVVAADNVLFASIINYIEYMQNLQKEGMVKTFTAEASVEYFSPDLDADHDEQFFRDGVEITTYLCNPII
ncbi:hypothetical protein CTEN210_03887 [Chaetoceros tenuissimus]|uniref:catechol O-methyltransferase n=1 Tax=Chaetoceros tenuissimus TaxID=426638 RepID=A0AAD3CJV2_9STRA|nr:hypothetical protein CTEN210_03887 [Chaetoceros tenuissimus]